MTNKPDPIYDDTFIIAPSLLTEGKAIGSADPADLKLVQNMLTSFDADPKNFAKRVKTGSSAGRKQLEKIQETVRTSLISAVGLYYGKKLDETQFRKRVIKTMKTAWRETFLAGLRTGGVEGILVGGKTRSMVTAPQDEAWLASASRHEMQFLNKFITAVVEDNYKMPLVQRVMLYVKTLRSFYESARVIGLPETCVIHWVGPHDKKSCAGCKYLFENGPYTKFTLCATPASGVTACLSNCRDRLLVRQASLAEVQSVATQSKYTREGHIRNLRRLKNGLSVNG
jgi:hypothetical protein